MGEAVGGAFAKVFAIVYGELSVTLGLTTAELEPDESNAFVRSSFMLASAGSEISPLNSFVRSYHPLWRACSPPCPAP